jgi:phosphoglycolate phosphatase-like HAD superfamily hydrolase
MSERRIDTVVWDLDNTIWDWIIMHLAGMRATSAKISEIIGIPEDDVKESMKKVYGNVKTFDYKALLQEMDVIHKWAGEIGDVRKMVQKILDLGFTVHTTYTHARNQNFHLYDGAEDVLSQIRNSGRDNVAISDAPLSKILRRLKHFGIDKYFDAIYGQPDAKTQTEIEGGGHLAHYEEARRDSGLYEVAIPMEGIVTLSINQRKPDIDLANILNKTREEVSQTVLVVGDSFAKDMMMAYNNGCHAVFAGYGVPSDPIRFGLYEYGPQEVVARNSAEISPENVSIIQKMGDKFSVAKKIYDVSNYVSNEWGM